MTQRLCNAYTFEGQDIASPANTENKKSDRDEYSEMMTLILSMSNCHSQTGKVASKDVKKDANKEQEEDKLDKEEAAVPYWSEEELAIIKAFYEAEREYEQEDKAMLEDYFSKKVVGK
ncbi:hypothetical protein A0J61_04635 [Choanephora cucurbitarum]|uniref:Uncharacterized protein n=1 Tax=Choanephora cucurbitarum TaxID=101091 RepID=A0A1C7NDY6_9FUNG|nr:hypothetical protein A0J61_04635 [Choanephora cucurbitarum]